MEVEELNYRVIGRASNVGRKADARESGWKAIQFPRQADLEKLAPRSLHRPVNSDPEGAADISLIRY